MSCQTYRLGVKVIVRSLPHLALEIPSLAVRAANVVRLSVHCERAVELDAVQQVVAGAGIQKLTVEIDANRVSIALWPPWRAVAIICLEIDKQADRQRPD